MKRKFSKIHILLAFFVIWYGCDNHEEDSTTIFINGIVTDIDDQSQISSANVQLRKWYDFRSSGRVLVETVTDANGYYDLSYTEEDYCGESLLRLTVIKDGYNTLIISKISSTNNGNGQFVRCTENEQIINIQLEKKID